MAHDKRTISRRAFLRLTAAASGVGLLAACAPQAAAPAAESDADTGEAAAPAAEIPSLIWTGWNAVEWYQPVVDEFMMENPDIHAEYTQLSDYKQQITLLAAGEQCDVIVTRDDDKAGFVDAGFIRPVGEEVGVQELVDDMYAGNAQAVSYKGNVYGLPYYTDYNTFMYNSVLFEQAGFTETPKTLSELSDMCVEMKNQGISDYPLAFWIYQESNFKEIMYSLVYASDGEWVDENWDPICQQSGSVVEETLAWMAKAFNDQEIVDRADLEMLDADVDEIFQNGGCVIKNSNRYDLRRFNDPEQTPLAVAGEQVFKSMLMPGLEGPGGVVTWTRQHTVNATAVNQEAAFRLQYFAGGKNADGEYWTPKQWHERFGLGFAYKSMASDPDVIAAESSWGDPELFAEQKATSKARIGLDAPWYSEWDNAMQAEWHKVMLQQITPSEATQAMADKWNELRDSYA